ncbi:uncharacterized protein LACBIDRAFT_192580 [Laccaria bicolor S238N-H82]|uniref:Nucleolar protein 16 n=1 Tax=Laccaria bicolor (strain S238N-H82 / ATCC MYA-4686) TaxID=486041 RepID=B0D3T7_LACBS|nr:uncharacterized protein LACBIDRAFT_192580 [Laccaria bicolor S238N-H82]EDR10983.1 predicted protein [Laccaria bicolor S238N-H82]|eukprot:XP_001878284.1 predicted protein [Laccaria bicolor S238N-H82]
MANPRQRRKTRSSTHKAVSHSRHAKRNLKKMPPIRGPKALQEAWDKKKTVKQNYTALGLIHSTNPSASGGNEQPSTHRIIEIPAEIPSASTTVDRTIPVGFGKIIRDEAGNVLHVELNDTEEESAATVANSTEMKNIQIDNDITTRWVTDLGGHPKDIAVSEKGGQLLETLESLSCIKHMGSATLSVPLSGAGPRHAAAGEVAYLQRLVKKYGNDVERMAIDRKLNPDQRTAGQLKRALRNSGLQISS